MNIAFFGDSFTWGDELNNPQDERFSRLVCEKLNANETNISRRGSGNEEICLNVTEFIMSNNQADFICIQLSNYIRYTYVSKDRLKNTPRYSTINPNSTSNTPKEKLLALSLYSLANGNYKLYYAMTRYKVYLLSEVLKSKNIPHFFIVKSSDVKDFLEDNLLPKSFYDNFYMKSIKNSLSEANISLKPGGHPSELGHKFIAEQILIPQIEKRL